MRTQLALEIVAIVAGTAFGRLRARGADRWIVGVLDITVGSQGGIGQDVEATCVVDAPAPNDPNRCGDSDQDTCDDCAVAGTQSPGNDGPDQDGDGICDAGDTDGGGSGGDGNSSGGCGCNALSPKQAAPWLLMWALLGLYQRARRLRLARRQVRRDPGE